MKREKNAYILMGVSGSGKTTLGKLLAQKKSIPFLEGDDFHPIENKEKIKKKIALEDTDRWPWLSKISDEANKILSHSSCVISCSALKESYRSFLINGINANVYYIFLKGSEKVISDRLELRKNHFMPKQLLQSQFETLEQPLDVLHVDVSDSIDSTLSFILKSIKSE